MSKITLVGIIHELSLQKLDFVFELSLQKLDFVFELSLLETALKNNEVSSQVSDFCFDLKLYRKIFLYYSRKTTIPLIGL